MTIRELAWAWQGREYPQWERTANLLAQIANTVPQDPKNPRRAAHPYDYFRRPGERRAKHAFTGAALRAMKSAFVKKK